MRGGVQKNIVNKRGRYGVKNERETEKETEREGERERERGEGVGREELLTVMALLVGVP